MPGKHAIAIILFSCVIAPAFAQQSGTPLQDYQSNTSTALYLCKLTYELAASNDRVNSPQDKQSDYVSCIRDAKVKAKTGLQKALPTVKKAKAKDALKNYHVAFMSAIDGIEPGDNERKISYEQRQQTLSGNLKEAWARFEVEE